MANLNHNFPLCFEVYSRSGITHSMNGHFYERLLHSLNHICNEVIFSLRYLYDPLSEQKLRFFMLINSISEIRHTNVVEQVIGLLTKGSLSSVYNFSYIKEGFPNLDWVTSIGEIIKSGEFVNQPEFKGYLPHLFETDLINNDFPFVELLDHKGYGTLVLEFSLKIYNSPNEQTQWLNAVETLVTHLDNSTAKNSYIRNALELYKKYQDSYFGSELYNYSIKALCINSIDTSAILETLLDVVSTKNMTHKNNPIITLEASEPRFSGSLEASRNVQIFKDIEASGWQQKIGIELQQKLIKETVSSGGLLSCWDDGSLNFPILPSNFRQSETQNTSVTNPNKGEIVLREGSPLAGIFKAEVPQVKHLKPLERITTYQEVIGFFQIFSPQNSESIESKNEKSIEEAAQKAHQSIEDLLKNNKFVLFDNKAEKIKQKALESVNHFIQSGENLTIILDNINSCEKNCLRKIRELSALEKRYIIWREQTIQEYTNVLINSFLENLYRDGIEELFTPNISYHLLKEKLDNYRNERNQTIINKLSIKETMSLSIAPLGKSIEPILIENNTSFSSEQISQQLSKQIQELELKNTIGFIPIFIKEYQNSNSNTFLFFSKESREIRPEITATLQVIKKGRYITINKMITICPLPVQILNKSLQGYTNSLNSKAEELQDLTDDFKLLAKLNFDFQSKVTQMTKKVTDFYLEQLKQDVLERVANENLINNFFMTTTNDLINQSLDILLGYENSDDDFVC